MRNAKLPTNLLVAAQIRIACASGITMLLRRRGEPSSGAIVLKIDLLNGKARVLTQIRLDDELAWAPASKTGIMTNEEAENYINAQINMDPDIWVVEIEDREGRHFFPGRIVSL